MLGCLISYACHGFKESDNLWWDAFATEFFEDDAMLTLSFSMEDGPKRYSEFNFVIFAIWYSAYVFVEFLFLEVEHLISLR